MFKEIKSSIKIALAMKKLKNASDIEAEKAQEFLKELLAQESGVFSKFSQYLGTSKNISNDLLYSRHNLLTLDDVRAIFESTFNKKFDEVFSAISDQPMKASIGQVYKAELKNGEKVALKVQYPEIKKTIYRQLKLMDLFPIAERVSPIKKWGIPVSEYQELFKKMADEELNYEFEIKNQKHFEKMNEDKKTIKTSKILNNFTAPNIYLQSFIEGTPISTAMNDYSKVELEGFARIIFESFLEQVFKYRFLQGDTNHGNFILNQLGQEQSVYFIDFGNCVHLDKTLVNALGSLIDSVIFKREVDPLPLLGDLGFDTKKLKHIHKQLPKTLEAFFWPLIQEYPCTLSDWKLDERLTMILGDHKWWFRSSGGTEFFTLMKAFSGYKALFSKWNVMLSWQRIYKNITNDFRKEFEVYSPRTSSEDNGITFSSLAKNLKIIVTENGIEKVNLSLPASVVENLEDVMDSETLKKLNERKVNISDIKRRSFENGGIPQELFELSEGAKNYKVFLK